MFVDHTVDLKNFYRVVEFISKICFKKLSHEEYKKIALNQSDCDSYLHRKVKRVANAYLYVLNNYHRYLTIELLEQIYFLLTNKKLNNEISKNILKIYYKNKDEYSFTLASLIHLYICKSLKYEKYAFAFIITNLVMLKKKRYPLIPYSKVSQHYKKIVKANDIEKLIQLFHVMETPLKKSITPSSISIDKIYNTINDHKQILTDKYCVEKLFLYGSYAKDLITVASDIDFLIVFNDDVDYKKQHELIDKLNQYLNSIFEISIDIIEFNHALNYLDISEMEKMKKII